MAKGILKVSKTNKGKIFVELDKLNGKSPMPLSYVSFSDTNLNNKECEYTVDDKGIILSILVDSKEVWVKQITNTTSLPVNNQQTTTSNSNIKTSSGTSPSPNIPDSLSLKNHTFLPKDVRSLNINDIDNFALKLQKAARYEYNENNDSYKFSFYKYDTRNNAFFSIKANYGHLENNFKSICKRQEKHVHLSFTNNNRKILLAPQWRFILGIGGESVYETGMTLHPLYGIPYLPSSSIKGVLRSWVISQVFAQPELTPTEEKNHPLINAEHRALTQSQLFCTIFGCPKDSKRVLFENNAPLFKSKTDKSYVYGEKEPSALNKEQQGAITFFDGLPTEAPVIKADIMNVHYKDWYKDINYSAPTDTQRPNPIHFLTVSNENDLLFQTYIATSNDSSIKDFASDYTPFLFKESKLNADSRILELVEYWLQKALSEQGIGAKTAVGYGYMTPPQ